MKNQKGITLIALVITIIVLLILAGVSISMVIGNNGILNQASTATTNYKTASEQEQAELAYLAAQMEVYSNGGTVDATAIQTQLDKAGVNATAEDKDGKTTITFENGNKYEIVDEVVTKVPGTTSGTTKYTVSYNANGGTGAPTDATQYAQGATVTVKLTSIPTKEGYTFKGWSTSAGATTATYTSSGTKQFTMGTSNITLYAVWENPWADAFEFDATTQTITGIKRDKAYMAYGLNTWQQEYFVYYNSPNSTGIDYLNGYGGCKLNETIDTLVVPSEINGVKVKNVQYLGAVNVKKLIFEEGIENIDGCYRLGYVSDLTFYMSTEITNSLVLEEIVIPTSVTTIGEDAFIVNLSKVNYRGTASQWNAITIGSNNDLLTNATRVYEYGK